MLIQEVARSSRSGPSGRNRAFLVYDNWDDYGLKTSFELIVFDSSGRPTEFGAVKIMKKGMTHGHVQLPNEPFQFLDSGYCSLGQGQNYYEMFANMSVEIRDALLKGLRDCVYDPSIFEDFRDEYAMQSSLLRSVDERTVRDVFNGALQGQVELTPFNFAYRFPGQPSSKSPALTFSVVPRSSPPTNIHAVIGRNSVGKTRLLWDIVKILCRHRQEEHDLLQTGELAFEQAPQPRANETFSRLVTVAFSAFDPFRAPREGSVSEGDIHYSYIGLKKRTTQGYDRGEIVATKNDEDLLEEFANSLANCSNEPRLQRWHDALELLETDPGFRDLNLHQLVSINATDRLPAVERLFQPLSSGHKIVLLTITRLVELVDERTLVLIDEPESHLHPPLLASLIRVLSMLLTRRNGAAILATHSPVVLQELPRSCVWLLQRSGEQIKAERPLIETFGENLSVLTREVFGLEVKISGFHKMVSDALSEQNGDYDKVLEKFNGQLGAEARAIALALSRLKQ